MNTAFSKNQQIKCTVEAQGFKVGQVCTVTDLDVFSTPFGTYVTYQLDGKKLVNNAHLLFEAVEVVA